ncbi:MAG: Mut7-C RNAse domain-containing protein [Nitrososphaerales archaeon]
MEAQPERRSDSAFLVDGMLGSLARKLRILGFDTLYDSKSNDQELLKEAIGTKRCLVTSDVDLCLTARRRKVDSILIGSRSERGRLFEVLAKIGASGIDETKIPRCSVCNGLLEALGRMDKHQTIYTCVTCGKHYWKGSHWKKLSMLFREVDLMLRNKDKILPP